MSDWETDPEGSSVHVAVVMKGELYKSAGLKSSEFPEVEGTLYDSLCEREEESRATLTKDEVRKLAQKIIKEKQATLKPSVEWLDDFMRRFCLSRKNPVSRSKNMLKIKGRRGQLMAKAKNKPEKNGSSAKNAVETAAPTGDEECETKEDDEGSSKDVQRNGGVEEGSQEKNNISNKEKEDACKDTEPVKESTPKKTDSKLLNLSSKDNSPSNSKETPKKNSLRSSVTPPVVSSENEKKKPSDCESSSRTGAPKKKTETFNNTSSVEDPKNRDSFEVAEIIDSDEEEKSEKNINEHAASPPPPSNNISKNKNNSSVFGDTITLDSEEDDDIEETTPSVDPLINEDVKPMVTIPFASNEAFEEQMTVPELPLENIAADDVLLEAPVEESPVRPIIKVRPMMDLIAKLSPQKAPEKKPARVGVRSGLMSLHRTVGNSSESTKKVNRDDDSKPHTSPAKKAENDVSTKAKRDEKKKSVDLTEETNEKNKTDDEDKSDDKEEINEVTPSTSSTNSEDDGSASDSNDDDVSDNEDLIVKSSCDEEANAEVDKWEADNAVTYSKKEEKLYKKNSKEYVDTVKESMLRCTGCNEQVNHKMHTLVNTHPLLGVLLCKRCRKYYGTGKFKKDEDGLDEYCRWCANGGDLLVCDSCTNGFCRPCIRRNLGRSAISEIEDSNNWKCYVCDLSAITSVRMTHRAVLDNLRIMREKEMKKNKKEKQKTQSSNKSVAIRSLRNERLKKESSSNAPDEPSSSSTAPWLDSCLTNVTDMLEMCHKQVLRVHEKWDAVSSKEDKEARMQSSRRILRLMRAMSDNFRSVEDTFLKNCGEDKEELLQFLGASSDSEKATENKDEQKTQKQEESLAAESAANSEMECEQNDSSVESNTKIEETTTSLRKSARRAKFSTVIEKEDQLSEKEEQVSNTKKSNRKCPSGKKSEQESKQKTDNSDANESDASLPRITSDVEDKNSEDKEEKISEEINENGRESSRRQTRNSGKITSYFESKVTEPRKRARNQEKDADIEEEEPCPKSAKRSKRLEKKAEKQSSDEEEIENTTKRGSSTKNKKNLAAQNDLLNNSSNESDGADICYDAPIADEPETSDLDEDDVEKEAPETSEDVDKVEKGKNKKDKLTKSPKKVIDEEEKGNDADSESDENAEDKTRSRKLRTRRQHSDKTGTSEDLNEEEAEKKGEEEDIDDDLLEQIEKKKEKSSSSSKKKKGKGKKTRDEDIDSDEFEKRKSAYLKRQQENKKKNSEEHSEEDDGEEEEVPNGRDEGEPLAEIANISALGSDEDMFADANCDYTADAPAQDELTEEDQKEEGKAKNESIKKDSESGSDAECKKNKLKIKCQKAIKSDMDEKKKNKSESKSYSEEESSDTKIKNEKTEVETKSENRAALDDLLASDSDDADMPDLDAVLKSEQLRTSSSSEAEEKQDKKLDKSPPKKDQSGSSSHEKKKVKHKKFKEDKKESGDEKEEDTDKQKEKSKKKNKTNEKSSDREAEGDLEEKEEKSKSKKKSKAGPKSANDKAKNKCLESDSSLSSVDISSMLKTKKKKKTKEKSDQSTSKKEDGEKKKKKGETKENNSDSRSDVSDDDFLGIGSEEEELESEAEAKKKSRKRGLAASMAAKHRKRQRQLHEKKAVVELMGLSKTILNALKDKESISVSDCKEFIEEDEDNIQRVIDEEQLDADNEAVMNSDDEFENLMKFKPLKMKAKKGDNSNVNSDDDEGEESLEEDSKASSTKRDKRKVEKKEKTKEGLLDISLNAEDDEGSGGSDVDKNKKKDGLKRTDPGFSFNEKMKKSLLASSDEEGGATDSEEDSATLRDRELIAEEKKKRYEKLKAKQKEKEQKEQEEQEKKDEEENNEDKGDGEEEEDEDDVKNKRKAKKGYMSLRFSSDDDDEEKDEKKKKKDESDEDYDSNDSEYESPRKSRMFIGSSDSDSDFDIFKSSKRRREKCSESDSDSDPKPKKKKRIKRPSSSTEEEGEEDEAKEESKNTEDTPSKRKVRRIIRDEDLTESTKNATQQETERRERIVARQKLYNKIFEIDVEADRTSLTSLVLDFDPETKKELVSVNPKIVSYLKPHQIEGVKFMWDATCESVARVQKEKGSGAILAHCMGLGKTLQVITFVHTLLSSRKLHDKICRVLVLCPVNTVYNWVAEFKSWLKGKLLSFEVIELISSKDLWNRAYRLDEWFNESGVCIIGYDMYRTLSSEKNKRYKGKMKEIFQKTLVDPGPDLVICDEGHILKNEATALSIAVNKMKTARRIILTGTPLQNNLKEYHCMIQFVKPNLLGTRKEFMNRFVNPIQAGSCADATPRDVKRMKRRAHILHNLLEGCVQRFDYTVLKPFLPPKMEYVISIQMSELQCKLYSYYLENLAQGGPKRFGSGLFVDFNSLSRVWTHPKVLELQRRRALLDESEDELEDFICDDTTSESEDEGRSKKKKKKKKGSEGDEDSSKPPSPEAPPRIEGLASDGKVRPDWWKKIVSEHVGENVDEGEWFNNIELSGKLVLLLDILTECCTIGDKVLLFSQSILALDMIEEFLALIDQGDIEMPTHADSLPLQYTHWKRERDYLRLDGQVSADVRKNQCKFFNDSGNERCRLFLISTRAGGIGINLVAANRVIIFDSSWNPAHDTQSIYRVYRFGQKKPCYIYRFVAQGTMEEKIYSRQVNKLSTSLRVVDEHQIKRYFNTTELSDLYEFNPADEDIRETPIVPEDRLLGELIIRHKKWIVGYHEHDSLLENQTSEELSEEERKAAWEDFENEKKGLVPGFSGRAQPYNPGAVAGAGTLPFDINDVIRRIHERNQHLSSAQLQENILLATKQIQKVHLSHYQRLQNYVASLKNPMIAPQVYAQLNYSEDSNVIGMLEGQLKILEDNIRRENQVISQIQASGVPQVSNNTLMAAGLMYGDPSTSSNMHPQPAHQQQSRGHPNMGAGRVVNMAGGKYINSNKLVQSSAPMMSGGASGSGQVHGRQAPRGASVIRGGPGAGTSSMIQANRAAKRAAASGGMQQKGRKSTGQEEIVVLE